MTPSQKLLKAEVEEHVNQLINEMTLEEKIGQLNQYFSWGKFDPEMVRGGKAGSVINASGALAGQGSSHSATAELTNNIQQLAMESRLKIPQLFSRDVIHGYRTIFPVPLAQACSWNPELAEQAASIAAREASTAGIKWTFAPMVDIARDARWGRIVEGNGEDPYLGSVMARAVVRGFQGDMSAPDKLVACAKHFAGYGSAEGGRDYENGEISDPTLRDIYLPPFEAAVDEGVGTFMSAFLDLNGIPATASRHLLTSILREEWGFNGFVVSDWESVNELINHGVAEDPSQAAVLALHAGVDMDMSSNAYINTLAASLADEKVTLDEIESSVKRILRVKHLAGLFENPFVDPERAAREILTEDARALAHESARQSMVLLKNKDSLLPLDDRFHHIAVIGPLVHASHELYGSWTPDGRPDEAEVLSETMLKLAPYGVRLSFTPYADRAVDLAMEADAVILIVGEHPRRSGENANVADLSLPHGQAELVEAVSATGKPIVMVVVAGRPLAITRQAGQVDSVLYAWFPGMDGGAALCDILFGSAAPSGRLPVTFPRASGQTPLYYNHKSSGRPLGLRPYLRTRYVDVPTAPLFPFGYGLTYTSFEYSNLQVNSETMRGSLQISADVTNTGQRAGNELVQLYVRDLVGSLTRPVRELKDFQHVQLQPGETRHVTFVLPEEKLAFTRMDGTHGVEPGEFHLWIAPDSVSGLQGKFRL